MHRAFSFISIVGLIIAGYSCKEQKDFYDPSVIISEPAVDQVFDLPDTLYITASLSDQDIIRSVVVSIVNSDKIPVIPGKTYYPDSREYTLEASLPLVDKTLKSGPFNLLITISDGAIQKTIYREIIIHEIPLQLQAFIAVTGQFNFKSMIIRLNPAFETDTQFIFPEGYRLSAVNSLWQYFFFVSPEPSSLVAFNTENFKPEWEAEAELPRPLYTGLFPDKELVFSTANGNAGIFSADGTVTLRTVTQTEKTIQCLAADDLYIYASSVSLSGSTHELTVFYRVSGAIRDQKSIAGEIITIIPEAGNALVFIQSSTDIKIMEYLNDILILRELKTLPDETLRSALKISDEQFLLLKDNGVLSYDLALNRLSSFHDQSYEFGRYDAVLERIFLVKDSTVYVFGMVTGNLLFEKVFTEDVLDFQILYNK